MRTCILTINPARVSNDELRKILDVLRRGGVMAYPTDTIYGLGADSRSAAAVEKIYDLKQREAAKPSPVLISNVDMAERLAAGIPTAFHDLADLFWPGPLTMILKVREKFPSEILGPGPSLAMRLPDVAWLRELVAGMDSPLVATSANISGEGDSTDPLDVKSVFKGKVDLILDGGRSSVLRPSTLVDLTSAVPKILREGAIPGDAILEALRFRKHNI